MPRADDNVGKRRGVKRNTVILVAIAVAVYVAFIAAGVVRSQAGL